jgi:hypothetical protein
MKKKHLIGLCFLIASQVVLLSSCDKTYGYPKDIVDGFYFFDAHFSNGANKTYKLNKYINAKVIGNCLVCDYKEEELYYEWNYYYRFIIDIENNSFQKYTAYTHYNLGNCSSEGGVSKTVIKPSSASIDWWIKENLSECFKIEDEFNSLEYSYTKESSYLDDGEWSDTTVTLCTSKFDNNGNKTLYQESKDSKVTYQEITNYNENNQILSKEEYNDYYDDTLTLSSKYEYTYDDANNLIHKKQYKGYSNSLEIYYDHSYEYDKDNHLISEIMDYQENNTTELRWRTIPKDYKKEYTYDGNKLIYEHDIIYGFGIPDSYILYDDKYYYTDEETKCIRIEKPLDTWNTITTSIYALDGRVLSIDEKYTNGEEEAYHSFEQYEYDNNQNLIKKSYSMLYVNSESNNHLQEGTHNEFYYYDSNNNLLKRIWTNDFIGDEKEKYKSIYQYDSDGFLLKKEEYAGLSNTFTYSFEWTGEGIEDIGFKENFKENK